MTSSDSAQDALRTSGFYCEKDRWVGGEFLRMEREDFMLFSKEGLEFYEVNILNNKHVRSVLDSWFPDYALARYAHFSSDPGHRFRFRIGTDRADMDVIVVMLWDEASSATFYHGSHRLDIPVANASNGLFEVRAPQLELNKAQRFTFEQGGLTVQDARTIFEIVSGTPIAAILAPQEIFKKWPRRILPDKPEIVQKVAEMNRARVTVYALCRAIEEERPPSFSAPKDDECPYCKGSGISDGFLCGKCAGHGEKHARDRSTTTHSRGPGRRNNVDY